MLDMPLRHDLSDPRLLALQVAKRRCVRCLLPCVAGSNLDNGYVEIGDYLLRCVTINSVHQMYLVSLDLAGLTRCILGILGSTLCQQDFGHSAVTAIGCLV